ncbi:MAG: hypothetical protein O6946_09705 [Gammaproteobacteria bacterium]|nr:hypothetical protein [Gammaproteobacteria bacterium]MCZ6826169.1 hypothetical protein [Gammaproteobacteria bacterium]
MPEPVVVAARRIEDGFDCVSFDQAGYFFPDVSGVLERRSFPGATFFIFPFIRFINSGKPVLGIPGTREQAGPPAIGLLFGKFFTAREKADK